jgi:secreted PhoX family phosphatase
MPVLAGAPSFVAAAGGSGAVRPPEPAATSAWFEAVDALVVPPGFDAQVLLAWGDRPFPNAADYVGFDHAHPYWLPNRGAEEGWLVVAHGAVSHPFHEAAPSAPVERATGAPAFAAVARAFDAVVGERLPDVAPGAAPGAERTLAGEALYNGGMSIVRVRRPARAGRFEVIRDAGNRRVHGLSGLAANAARVDADRAVTEWAPAQAAGSRAGPATVRCWSAPGRRRPTCSATSTPTGSATGSSGPSASARRPRRRGVPCCAASPRSSAPARSSATSRTATPSATPAGPR